MKTIVLSLAIAALCGSAIAADYQFLNINFDNDTLGQVPATAAPGTGVPAPGNPITVPYALGGYTATDVFSPPTAANGSILVSDVAGLQKAAVLTTNSANGVLGALYMDTGFSMPSQQISLGFDIGVLAAPTAATAQPKLLNQTTDTAGILFGINTFAPTPAPGAWAFRFALAPTSETGGVFALRSADNTRLITFGEYTEGDIHRVDLVADYTTGTVDAYLDGTLALDNHPFWTAGIPSGVSTSEFFMHLNGESGYANSVVIDNITASNFAAVPEPGTLALLLAAALAGVALYRRGR